MRRKWEATVGIIGGILALVFFGGLAVTLKKMSIKDFETSYQALKLEKIGTLDNTFHLLQDMTGVFAITLFISLIFLVVAVFFSVKEKYLIIAASLYLVAGLILLLGTQFIAFPFTFFYFMAAVLTVHRIKIKKGQMENV